MREIQLAVERKIAGGPTRAPPKDIRGGGDTTTREKKIFCNNKKSTHRSKESSVPPPLRRIVLCQAQALGTNTMAFGLSFIIGPITHLLIMLYAPYERYAFLRGASGGVDPFNKDLPAYPEDLIALYLTCVLSASKQSSPKAARMTSTGLPFGLSTWCSIFWKSLVSNIS